MIDEAVSDLGTTAIKMLVRTCNDNGRQVDEERALARLGHFDMDDPTQLGGVPAFLSDSAKMLRAPPPHSPSLASSPPTWIACRD